MTEHEKKIEAPLQGIDKETADELVQLVRELCDHATRTSVRGLTLAKKLRNIVGYEDDYSGEGW